MASSASHPVYPVVADILCVDPSWCQPEARLADAPNSDSLDIVELQMALEDSLGIELPDEDMAQVSTVGDLTALVETKLAARDAVR